MFRELNRKLGLTIVIVTHDRMLAKKVNRVVAIRDGKTSSEMIMKQSYADRWNSIETFADVQGHEEEAGHAYEEYVVLDRAGRVQIPKEYLENLGVKGNKVRMELEDGRIVIDAPEGDA